EHMQAWIDKVASECVAVRLRMLNRIITNIYDDALRSLDLKVSQMNILVAASKLGTARPIEVCEHLHLDVAAEGRNVEMEMLANFNGASRAQLGGGDQNVHL